MCLQAGRGINGMIGHTQPRRLAAKTMANRIAEELSVSLGELVGCQELGRMVLAAHELRCSKEVMLIVSELSVQDPRERPGDKQQQASQSHARFVDPRSDFIALLNLE